MKFQLDGHDLKDWDGRWDVMVGTAVSPPVTVRSSNVVIPGVSGELSRFDLPFDTPQLPMEFQVRGNTDSDLIENWSALMGLLYRGKILTRETNFAVHHAEVSLLSVSEPEYNNVAKLMSGRAVFKMPSVFWRGEEKTWSQVGDLNGFHEIPTLAGSTAPINDLKFKIKGPGTFISIASVDNKGDTISSFNVNTSINSGEYLIIDPANFKARQGPDADWDSGGSDVSKYTHSSKDPHGFFLYPYPLVLDASATVVRFNYSSQDTTAASELHVKGRGAWL